jgi:carboxypeptidase D
MILDWKKNHGLRWLVLPLIIIISTLPSSLSSKASSSSTVSAEISAAEATTVTSRLPKDRNDQNRHQSSRRLIPNYPGDDGQRRAVKVPTVENPEDHRIKDLPLHDGSLKTPQYAGLLPASGKGDKYLFYWFFYPDITDYKGKDENIPLLLWLNGGPGCSSMDGLFLENGPLQWHLDEQSRKWTLTSRPASWHRSPAYVVYVDQPVGTGLSFTTSRSYPKNDEEVNADFYYWLQQFLQLHADVLLTPDQRNLKRPFFFSGESHAGHYIPSMMAYIHKLNQAPWTTLTITLSGAAIGNGWMDPFYQYASAEAAYGHGLIGRSEWHALDVKEKQCQDRLMEGEYNSGICFDLLDEVVSQSYGTNSQVKVSQYDIRQQESKHSARDFPPGHRIVETYLGGSPLTEGIMESDYSSVLKALHATSSRQAGQIYQECTDPPYNALSHQDGLGVMDDVKYILESGIKMFFFNGVMDLVCNHVGNELLLEKMTWKHQKDYILAPRYAWLSGRKKTLAGYVKAFENLIFLKVLNSGHMVPLDQPDISLNMIINFLYGKSFQSSEQSLSRDFEPESLCPTPDSNQVSGSDSSASDSNPAQQDDNYMKFVVENSWLGASLAATLFLGLVCYTLRRSSNTRHHPESRIIYSDLEMKTHYRDQDDEDNNSDDDDNHQDDVNSRPTNGITIT